MAHTKNRLVTIASGTMYRRSVIGADFVIFVLSGVVMSEHDPGACTRHRQTSAAPSYDLILQRGERQPSKQFPPPWSFASPEESSKGSRLAFAQGLETCPASSDKAASSPRQESPC